MRKSNNNGGGLNGVIGKGSTTDMYGAIWTNSISPEIKFLDYTLQDHFGKTAEIPCTLPVSTPWDT